MLFILFCVYAWIFFLPNMSTEACWYKEFFKKRKCSPKLSGYYPKALLSAEQTLKAIFFHPYPC
jgi:hypothetical protein